MRIERTHGFDEYGLLVHHLVAKEDDGTVLAALPRFPEHPTHWWNGKIDGADREAIQWALRGIETGATK